MLCLLQWSLRRLQLAAAAVCFVSVAVIILFCCATIFMSNVNNVSRKEPNLIGHRHRLVLLHDTNCRAGSVDCTNHSSQVVSYKPHSVDLDHISARIVSSRKVAPLHNGSRVRLVPFHKLSAKGSGSIRHYMDTVPAVSLSRDVNQTLFRSRELVIWSTDHHPAPAYDARHLLEPLGVRFLQHDLSPYCSFFNLCAQRESLKVINADNMFNLDPALIPKFYEAYKNEPLMQSVDAFLCYDPPAICELYEPFNKSLIIIASNRYYITRQSSDRWKTWNKKFVNYASDPRNIVAANNRYDVEMIRYFTGLQAEWIPSFAGYTRTTYNPSRQGFLLAKRRVDEEFEWSFLEQFKKACKSINRSLPVPELIRIKDRYPRYKYSDLAAHQGVVHLPYQVSTMSIFEQYRMNIPLFFPSKELLLRWSIERWVVRERTLPWLVRDPRPYTFPSHPSQRHIPSPNDNDDPEAIKYWLQFADYYTLPHITYFNSTEHLAVILQKLTADDLKIISWQMKNFNKKARRKLLMIWTRILQTVAKFSPNHPH